MHQQLKAPRSSIAKRITYANVMSTIAVFLTLGGATALAAGALEKNSVGSRQLKSKAVTTGKIANNAVNAAKVANGSLTGQDINIGALGIVPAATTAASAGNANTVGGHAASCPTATTLIRGVCFDSAANPEAPDLKTAADACAAKGGYLPTPLQLYSVRGVLNLGSGSGTDHMFTDVVYANTAGANYSTINVNGTGAFTEQAITSPSRYYCAYALVR